LKVHFPAHYRLCELLNLRKEPPTLEEIALARKESPMDEAAMTAHLKQLESISKNIQDMFQKQAAAQAVSKY
jgi:hypothetical protein